MFVADDCYRHVTAVEERLRRAEALLREIYSEDQLTGLLNQPLGSIDESTVRAPEASASSNTPKSTGDDPGSGYTDRRGGNGELYLSRQDGAELGYLGSLPITDSDLLSKPRSALDRPPAATDDFEWNEQDQAWLGAATQDEVTSLPSPDSNVNRVRDGMATLTMDESSSGYFGITSGAALLRLTMINAEAAESEQQAREQRRESLLDLFSEEANGDPVPSSWLRTEPLLTRIVVEDYIEAYFKLYHPSFPILHEATFRAEYAYEAPRPIGGVWHVLANLVVAMGAFVSGTNPDDTDLTIFKAVKAGLSIESLEAGSLTLVQIFALAANYLQKRNKPNTGSAYAGIAVRLAIGLGLHKEFVEWKTSLLRKEIRRRVWWLLCILDVGATVSYGRPLIWPQAGVDAALPANIHEPVSFEQLRDTVMM